MLRTGIVEYPSLFYRKGDYYESISLLGRYLRQGSKCFICQKEIVPEEYCVINVIEGVRVIHFNCLKEVRIEGCMAQLEMLFEQNKKK